MIITNIDVTKKMQIMFILSVTALFFMFFPALTVEAASSDKPLLKSIYDVFEAESVFWFFRLSTLLWYSFSILMTISFFVQITKLALADSLSPGGIIHLLVKFALYAGFYRIIFNVYWDDGTGSTTNILFLIPNTFIWLAEKVTGKPSDTFALLTVAENMVQKFLLVAGKADFLTSIFATIPIGFLNIVFYLIVGQMIMTRIEILMVAVAGLVLLVFDGFMNMFDYGKKYLGALIAGGFKLFMLGIICGVIQSYSDKLVAYADVPGTGFWDAIMVALGVVAVLYIVAKNVPAMVEAILKGGTAGALNSGVVSLAGAAAAGAALYGGGKAVGQAIQNTTARAASYIPQGFGNFTPSKMSGADEPPVSYDDGSKG